jgi:hypothetical protein
MNIKVYKLLSGEDIVGELIRTDEKIFILKNVAKFVVTHQGIGMMPFFPYSKTEELTLKYEHVVCSGEVEDEVYSAYSAQYGTGIVLGTSQDLDTITQNLKMPTKR